VGNSIVLSNISKSFGGNAVIPNFSAELSLDGVTVLRGPSGVGKTTLFRLLLGLEQPDAGEIIGMQGRKPAVVFQEDRLLPWASALENVALVSDSATAETILAKLGLGDSMHLLPRELSGGMQRRVAIARALAYHGDVLFLDEPFTGLDEENKRIAANAILDQHIPVYVITHEDDEAELFGAYRTLPLPV
jgi:ABC-type nitrate/sulfonate/bicarbonate transport system ATPase subunit